MGWQEELKKTLLNNKITKGCYFICESRPRWIAFCIDDNGGWVWARAFNITFCCENHQPFNKEDFFDDSPIKILYKP
jgi:hypothetical protein